MNLSYVFKIIKIFKHEFLLGKNKCFIINVLEILSFSQNIYLYEIYNYKIFKLKFILFKNKRNKLLV